MLTRVRNRAKKLLPKNSFARGVSLLMGGTAGAQLLMILAAPLLARLYSPEDFGLLAVYAGLLSVMVVIASLRYELAIPLPEKDADAASVVVLSLLTVIATTIMTAIAVYLIGNWVAYSLGTPGLSSLMWLLPVGVLLQGIYNVFNYWALRSKQFSTVARTRIRQALATLSVQLGAFKIGGLALLLGQAGGQGVGSFTLAKSALRSEEFRHLTWGGIWRSAKRYRNFPLYSTWSGLFNTAGSQLPPLMFAAFFSVGAAGFYALAHRVLAMPMSIIGQAVANVFFSNAAEAYREGTLGPMVAEVHEKLAKIAMPPVLLLMSTGPGLFAFVFGEQWRVAGEFARWMAPWLYMVFITSPLSTLFSVMDKQAQGMMFQALLLLTRIAAIALGAWYDNVLLAVILFSGASVFCWTGFLIWIAILTGNSLSIIIRPTIIALLISSGGVLPLWLGMLSPASSWTLGVAAICSMALLLVYYWRLFQKAY